MKSFLIDQVLRSNEIHYFIKVVIEDKQKKEEIIMKDKNIRLPLPPVDTPCAYVNVKAGATVPIPNKKFHMARIDVGLHYPCHPEKIDEVFEKVRDWVDNRMKKEYLEMTGEAIETKDNIEVI